MSYNLTLVSAADNATMLTFTQGVNTNLMGGMLGALLLIGIAAIIFISINLTTRDIGKAFAGTSFICFMLALPLVALELLHPIGLFITLIGTAVSVATLWRK